MSARDQRQPRSDTLPGCYYHKEQAIQNFCVSRSCCLPLCPKCIQTHIEQHDKQGTVPIIESYVNVVGKITSSLQSSIAQLAEELRSLDDYSPNSNITHYAETINKSKEIMLKQLGNFFDNLQLKIEEALKMQYDRLCTAGAETVGDQLKRMIESLKATENQLASRTPLPAIIKYIGEDRELEVEQLKVSLHRKKNVFKDSLPALNINLADLGSLFSRVIGLDLSPSESTNRTSRRQYSRERGVSPRELAIEMSRRRSPSKNILQIASLENQLHNLRAMKSVNLSTRRSRY